MPANNYFRPKTNFQQNLPLKSINTDEFFQVEMKVDQDLFEGNIEEIVPGAFVSFRYTGEYNAFGPPVNPKISCIIFHNIINMFNSWYIYAIRSDIDSWSRLLHGKRAPPGMPTVHSELGIK